jgi:hypothetical protein
MGELIIDCPKYGHKTYLINTQVADHVVDKACADILKYYHPEAVIDFKQLF